MTTRLEGHPGKRWHVLKSLNQSPLKVGDVNCFLWNVFRSTAVNEPSQIIISLRHRDNLIRKYSRRAFYIFVGVWNQAKVHNQEHWTWGEKCEFHQLSKTVLFQFFSVMLKQNADTITALYFFLQVQDHESRKFLSYFPKGIRCVTQWYFSLFTEESDN